jgi:HK97 family phage major capsid protein
LVNCVSVSAGSVRFIIDNAHVGLGVRRILLRQQPDAGPASRFGELGIKAEPVRCVTVATSDLLQDAAFDVESWLFRKASRGMRATTNSGHRTSVATTTIDAVLSSVQ